MRSEIQLFCDGSSRGLPRVYCLRSTCQHSFANTAPFRNLQPLQMNKWNIPCALEMPLRGSGSWTILLWQLSCSMPVIDTLRGSVLLGEQHSYSSSQARLLHSRQSLPSFDADALKTISRADFTYMSVA